MGKTIDISGQRFGSWTVTSVKKFTNSGKNYRSYWLCICDCGTERYVCHSKLRQGESLSCGCKNKLPEGEAAFNRVFTGYKTKSNRFKIEFALSKEQFRNLVEQNCYYCNSLHSNISTSNYTGNFKYNGIDRKDSSRGYTIDNCVPCCKHCNRAKLDRSEKDFIEWIKLAYNNLFGGQK